jgi:hypothetical protein
MNETIMIILHLLRTSNWLKTCDIESLNLAGRWKMHEDTIILYRWIWFYVKVVGLVGEKIINCKRGSWGEKNR